MDIKEAGGGDTVQLDYNKSDTFEMDFDEIESSDKDQINYPVKFGKGQKPLNGSNGEDGPVLEKAKISYKPTKEESEKFEAKVKGEKKEEEKPVKIIRAKVRDQESDYHPEALIPVTIRGETKEASLQDLINNYSGTVDFKAKYDTFNREKQIYEHEKRKFDQIQKDEKAFLDQLRTKAISNNPNLILEAFEDILERSQIDSQVFINDLVKAFYPMVEKYSAMDEKDRLLHEKDIQLQARDKREQKLKKEWESKEEAREKDQFIQKIAREVEEKNQLYKVSMEEFDNAFKKLEEVKEKGYFEGDIEPAHIYAHIIRTRAEEKAKEFLPSVAPELWKDEKKGKELVNDVLDLVLEDYWKGQLQDENYYQSLVREALGVKSAKEVSEKLASTKPKMDASKKPPLQEEEPFKYDPTWGF